MAPPTAATHKQQYASSSSSKTGTSNAHRSTTGTTTTAKPTTRVTDKLKRAWRSLASSVVVSARAADKLTTKKQSTKELDDSITTTLHARNDVRRYVTAIEANLLGQEQELEALEEMLKSQPRVGRRKRQKLK